MKDSETRAAIVLVRPDLITDPAGHQGKIGVIAYAKQADDIYVRFENGEGVYPSEALFQLKNKKELFAETMKGSSLAIKDFKDLYKISLLHDIGKPKDIVQALEIARDNPAIWDRVLEPAGETLAQRQAQNAGR